MKTKIKIGRFIIAVLIAMVIAQLVKLGVNAIELPEGVFFSGWFGCAGFCLFLFWDKLFADKTESITPEKSRYEIEKTLILSTGHVSEHEFNTMQDDDEFPYRVIKHEYGLIVVLTDLEDIGEFVDADSYMRGHFSNVWSVVKFAENLGCKYINFDQDGEVYEELKEFDW